MATIPPILLSLITCERVLVDKFSGMGSVINIVQTISAAKYPARHSRIVLFCELTNGHGIVKPAIKLVDVQKDDKIFFEQKGHVEFRNVKQIVNLVMDLQDITFPHAGEYRFQLFADEHLLGERRIICREIHPPAKNRK